MNDMNDMRAVIMPKSDQQNADDFLAGPMTITVTKVEIRPGTEQPVSIFFDGDGGKPYKPCKSMARVMVACWGHDANKYVGRSMTLYCDPKVTWGGMAVGGIRISHMSDIDGAKVMALTATKGSKKPFTVKPLIEFAGAQQSTEEFLDRADRELAETKSNPPAWLAALVALTTIAPLASDLTTIRNWPGVVTVETTAPAHIRKTVREAFEMAFQRLAPVENDPTQTDDGWPGPDTKAAA